MITRIESKPRSKKWQKIPLPSGKVSMLMYFVLFGLFLLYIVYEAEQDIIVITNEALAEHLEVPLADIPKPEDIFENKNALSKHALIFYVDELKVYDVFYRYKDKKYNVNYYYEESLGRIFEETTVKLVEE